MATLIHVYVATVYVQYRNGDDKMETVKIPTGEDVYDYVSETIGNRKNVVGYSMDKLFSYDAFL